MLALIRRVGTEFGIDIVISSHHLEEAERICDAVVILGDGRMIARRGSSASSAAAIPSGCSSRSTSGHQELAALLRAAGLEVRGAARRSSSSGDELHDVVRDAVADLGLGLRRLAAERQTLEDVYLEASA